MPTETESSVQKPNLNSGQVICHFLVIKKLGCGGFGSVYEMEKDGSRYALKAETVTENNSGTLRSEALVLRRAQFSPHICRFYFAGSVVVDNQRLNVIVMSLLSHPLNKLRRACPQQRFTRSTAIRLSIQCLQAIADLHSVGFVHRDVKAGNFAMSYTRIVTLIDFGFARRFIDIDEKNGSCNIRRPRDRASFVGTTRYCSKNVHARKEQSRRDDLWAWLYMLVEMITGSLPWSNYEEKRMARVKERLGTRITGKCPHELIFILHHIQSLNYSSKPNYSLIHRHLQQICTRCGFNANDPYDWEENGRYPLQEQEEEEEEEVGDEEEIEDEEEKVEEAPVKETDKAHEQRSPSKIIDKARGIAKRIQALLI